MDGKDIKSMTIEELTELMAALKEKPFRAKTALWVAARASGGFLR